MYNEKTAGAGKIIMQALRKTPQALGGVSKYLGKAFKDPKSFKHIPTTPIGSIAASRGQAAGAGKATKALANLMAGNKTSTGIRATLGGLHGYYGSPKYLGYEDQPAARRMSTALDAITAAYLPNLGGTKALGAYLTGQTAPLLYSGFDKGRGTIDNLGESMKGMGRSVGESSREVAESIESGSKNIEESAKTTSIPHNISEFMQTPEARGLGAGAAVAGLGALGSGLMRPKSEEEEMEGKGRTNMVAKDFMRYLLPAMAAGGLIGHYTGGNDGE